MQKVRIGTWNVNSIRVRLEMLFQVIKLNNLDIILLQETKCRDEDFPVRAIEEAGYNVVFKGQKSYNGVAIVSKHPLDVEITELPMYDATIEDEEARYIEAIATIDKKIVRVASVYVPNGASALMPGETLEESKRFRYKLEFYKRLQNRILEIKPYFNDEAFIIAGDFNVANEPIDVNNPQLHEGCVCYHPMERRDFKELLKETDLTDTFRQLYPNKVQYTWWDFKTRAFSRNVGWRLDYLLSSPNVIKTTTDCWVDMDTRALPKTSDHAPSIIEFEL